MVSEIGQWVRKGDRVLQVARRTKAKDGQIYLHDGKKPGSRKHRAEDCREIDIYADGWWQGLKLFALDGQDHAIAIDASKARPWIKIEGCLPTFDIPSSAEQEAIAVQSFAKAFRGAVVKDGGLEGLEDRVLSQWQSNPTLDIDQLKKETSESFLMQGLEY